MHICLERQLAWNLPVPNVAKSRCKWYRAYAAVLNCRRVHTGKRQERLETIGNFVNKEPPLTASPPGKTRIGPPGWPSGPTALP
eukprot:1572607-Pleurochrysis_carterae.AAC.1